METQKFLNQYPEIPPWLSPANPPAVLSTLGLGTGGGAGLVNGQDWRGFGQVLVYVGSNYNPNGQVRLQFPSIPPTLFFSADESFGPISVSGQGTTIVNVTWTSGHFVPGSKAHRIWFEWNVSR